MASKTLEALPEEVTLCILRLIEPKDVASMRMTCASILRATRAKQLWMFFIELYFTRRGVPLPIHCRPLEQMSSKDVETLLAHLMRMHGRTHSARTVSLEHLRLVHIDQPRPVTWVKIVRDQWVLVASSDAATSCLMLFTVDGLYHGNLGAVSTAYVQGPIMHGAVCTARGSVTIAVDVHSLHPVTEILALCADETSPPTIHRVRTISQLSYIHDLHENFVAGALWDGVGVPSVVDWETGSVAQLADLPDISGGCICMAIHGNLVAAVWPSRFALFRLILSGSDLRVETIHSQRIASVDGNIVGSADIRFSFSSNASEPSMHLLLSSSSGVEILVMEEIHHAGLNVLRQVWHMAQPDPSQVEDFLPAPLFGRQPSAISWLSYPFHGQRLVAFHFAQFAGRRWGSAELRGPETFMVRDDAVPALYYLPVRDYDEGRGVGVFANGYGEVAVCSVSGTDLQKLRQCFETLTLGPPQAAWERLPTTAVSSSIVPPHPCYLTTALDPVHERAQLWAAHTPAHIPDGFRVDWELDYDAGVWNMFTPYPFAPGWRLEHAYKILGRAIPLFRDPGETFFSAGGCFYMLNEEDDVLYAVPPGTPYEELVRIALRPHGERGLVVMEGDGVMEWCADLFYKMVVYDREVLGRDRGEEMRARLQT